MAITDQFIKAPNGLIIMEPEASVIETIQDSPGLGDVTMYIAFSSPTGGMLTSADSLKNCAIKKVVTVVATGIQTVMWANGNTRYDKLWTGRVSYTYGFLAK